MYSRVRLHKGVIAVLGDELFTLGLGMGGAIRKYIIPRGSNAREFIKKALNDVYESNIPLLIVQDKYRDVVTELRQPSRVPPIIVYVPDYITYEKVKAKEYYLSLIRRYLGISIELG